jgi:hypothetical protein
MKPGFSSGKKSLESLPPTQVAVLCQHICRTVLLATIWSQATSVHMDIPDFRKWGWHRDSSGRWLPHWTALEDSSKAFSTQLQCGCMKSSTRNCKCSRDGVRCTVLCKCEGEELCKQWGCMNAPNTCLWGSLCASLEHFVVSCMHPSLYHAWLKYWFFLLVYWLHSQCA